MQSEIKKKNPILSQLKEERMKKNTTFGRISFLDLKCKLNKWSSSTEAAM